MTRKRTLTGRRAFILGSGALAGMGAFATVSRFRQNNSAQVNPNLERSFAVAGDTPLRERAQAKGLLYGSSANYTKLSSDPEYAALLARECNLLVAGSDLLWKNVHPKPDSFDFSGGDGMVQFSRTHGMFFLGTHLVWHVRMPNWVEQTVNRQNAEQVLQNHVKTVAEHYAGNVYAWSVVNEAIQVSGSGRSDRLRKTLWFQSLGPDYIEIAFRAAAEADPQALLVYNDNGLDHDVSFADAKRDAVLKLLERLKSTGTPVHALGMQAHLFRNNRENRFNPTKLRSFLSDVAGLGLKILVTELDITDKFFPSDTAVRDRMVAQGYEDYLSIMLNEPATIAISNWGLSDRYTWLKKKRPREDNAQVRSLPFDAELRPKPAYNAIARAFDQAPVREARINLPSGQAALQDVQGHWAQSYVQSLAAKNIISGYPDGTFRPNAPVTRAEFAAIVNKAFTPAKQNNGAVAFQDVPQNYWGYGAIQTAVGGGFLAGYPNGLFQPNQRIPRAQVLVSLASGLKLGSANTGVLSFYQDAAQIPTYAAGKVAAATKQKLVVNYPTVRLLSPNREATRAEVAAFVYQAMVSDGKAEPIASPYIAVPSS